MGQFSWFTHDTNKQIGSEERNTITVYMHDNKGNVWKEEAYEGYGDFGEKDYYELLAEMNGLGSDRDAGIDLELERTDTPAIFPALVQDPNYNIKRHDFRRMPAHDPNQSWYDGDEDEDPRDRNNWS
jgi:hypothetical protein